MAASQVLALVCCMLVFAKGNDDFVVTDTSPISCPVGPPAASTGSNCVADCAGVNNGDYQSCIGCHVYVSCSNGRKFDNRPCPANLVWDDNIKRCEWTSATCDVVQKGLFHADLEANDIGSQYIDNVTWSLIQYAQFNGLGLCDTHLLYKFNPPACVKTVSYSVKVGKGPYSMLVLDTNIFVDGIIEPSFVQTMAKNNNLAVRIKNPHAGAEFPNVNSPICIRISNGSVAFSAGAMSKTVSGNLFHHMATEPLLFFVNVANSGDWKETPGICSVTWSLTVTWSC